MTLAPHVAVCGPGDATEEEVAEAEEVGRLLAESGAVLLCGGLGGVMEAAARGARGAGGVAVGVLPGDGRSGAAPHLTAAIATGLGQGRNAVLAAAADAIIAIGGAYGTLSEIGLGLKLGRPVIGLRTWELGRGGRPVEAIHRAETAEDAVALALRLASRGPA